MNTHDHHHHDTPQHRAATGDDLHHEELFDAEGHYVGKGHHEEHHVTPLAPMAMTLIILIVLTVVTVLTAKFIHLPAAGNLILALVIACIKGTLVAAFFMHLLYDKAVNTVVVIATMFAVLLFLVLTMTDIGTRKLHEPLEDGEIVHGGGSRVVETDGVIHIDVKGEYGPPLSAAPGKSVLERAREAYHAAGGHGESHGDDHAPADGAAHDDGHGEATPAPTGEHAPAPEAPDAHANAPASTEHDAPKANTGTGAPH